MSIAGSIVYGCLFLRRKNYVHAMDKHIEKLLDTLKTVTSCYEAASAICGEISSALGISSSSVMIFLYDIASQTKPGSRGLVVRGGGNPMPTEHGLELLPCPFYEANAGRTFLDGKGQTCKFLSIPIGYRGSTVTSSVVVIVHHEEVTSKVREKVEMFLARGGSKLVAALTPRGFVKLNKHAAVTGNSIESWSWNVFLECPLEGTYGDMEAEELQQRTLFICPDAPAGKGPVGTPSPTPSAVGSANVGLERMLKLALEMFGSPRTGRLTETFQLSSAKLEKFLSAVFSNYKRTNAFHNLYHAFSVFHAAWLIAGTPTAQTLLTPLDTLCLLLAALGHDLDHPGNSNGFEKALGSELALRHNDCSILERHHSSRLSQLLVDSGLLAPLSPEKAAYARKTLISAVLHTDMVQHDSLVHSLNDRAKHHAMGVAPQMNAAVSASTPVNPLILGILHSADLSGQAYASHIAQNWSKRVVAEFRAQAAWEKALKLQLSPWMHGLDTVAAVAKSQNDFITKVAIPLWQALALFIPELSQPLENLKASAEFYSKQLPPTATKN